MLRAVRVRSLAPASPEDIRDDPEAEGSEDDSRAGPNCWEYRDCPFKPGAARRDRSRVCPVVTRNAGQACWLVAGTFCQGKPQGHFVSKAQTCMACDFYALFDLKHRVRQRRRMQREEALRLAAMKAKRKK